MQPAFLSGLNAEQLDAVTLPYQSALILAGAGSGKTRVLTTRIAWLISTGQASPASILAVTFTNKAAREMLTRLSAMLPINTRGMWIGTFHGLCNRLLRAHHHDAGLPQTFQILDSQDQQSAIKRLLKAMNVDDERYPARQVQWFINAAKEEGRRARDVESYDDYTRRLSEIYADYDEQCNREGVVDFAELLLRCFELLVRNEILRDHYRTRFRHILVDEFQDTNVLQYRWLKLLAGVGAHTGAAFALTAPGGSCAPEDPGCAVFAVGDDDQSIYAFRGANVANMEHFERDFHVRRVIKLEQNYRSHGNILDAANAVIANNRKRLGKNLWTAEGKGEPIRICEAMSDTDEAGFIVDEVKSLVAEGVRPCDIAVLYRSNAQSRVLEHALFSAGLAYRVYGGLRFFERQEIKHALAYLRLVASTRDDNALLRVVNFPTRGIGSRTLEQLRDAATAAGSGLWEAAKARSEAGKRKPAAAESSAGAMGSYATLRGIEGFVALIERLRSACEGLALAECIEHVVEASGLAAHYRAEREGAERLENLGELVNAAALFAADSANEDTSLVGFLSHAALEAGEHQAEAGVDALQLMTVHSAKGLEFHTVFLSGLEEGLFPHENSLTEDDGLAEERRLMYVAITRARRRLYVTYAQSRMLHGQTRYNIRSRFLLELPPLLLKPVGGARRSGEASDARAAAPIRPERVGAGAEIAPASPWRIGQSVVHPKFGRGVIIGAEGRGADARVQVNFHSSGMKWLALEYAKLSAA
ncbi:MAG: UvrD-helicase domain-containing protein [Burkholderiales bacterium]|nr:UvrD-helicase domain-containing protein [Burkholderiales bacterium]